jgi:hypothetical protein
MVYHIGNVAHHGTVNSPIIDQKWKLSEKNAFKVHIFILELPMYLRKSFVKCEHVMRFHFGDTTICMINSVNITKSFYYQAKETYIPKMSFYKLLCFKQYINNNK